jgi:hypothetical protein
LKNFYNGQHHVCCAAYDDGGNGRGGDSYESDFHSVRQPVSRGWVRVPLLTDNAVFVRRFLYEWSVAYRGLVFNFP